MNNIAEGFWRSNTKEKLQYMNIAVWSAQEVKSMLFLALDLHYISEQYVQILLEDVQKVIETTQWFRRYLKTLISE